MDLKQYEQKKFALAEIIRATQAIDTKDGALLSEARELQARLAEDRFNLMVVGRFSRGKSTLMNALLGGDFLPTGIVPLTSVITTVRYGSRKQVVLHFTGTGLTREAPLSQLAEYVTQRENPGNVKKLAYAEVQFPVEVLRRGFFFVDSPGLGSPILENTLTTERFLPQADAFILVTSYESPLSEEEDRILQRIRNTRKKLYVVMNKQDTVGREERDEAIEFVKERLEQFSFAEDPQIFSISAREALEAKQTQNTAQLERSGLQEFETELMRFLIEERTQSFLVNMYERTTSFLIERSRAGRSPALEDAYLALIERLRDQRSVILGASDPPQDLIRTDANAAAGPYALEVDRKTGCRICGEILESIFRFLSKYQYDLTIQPEMQQDHARRGGFCTLHTWQYEGISSPQGVCEAYPRITHSIAEELARFAGCVLQQGESIEMLRSLLSTSRTCRVCQERIDAERRAVAKAADAVRRAADQERHVPACCLPHLVAVVESLGPGTGAQNLLQAHAHLMERTSEDLQRYALKHDALRRDLTSEEERRASQLALLLLAGHRNVSAPWVIEYLI
ncbi:MAG TPA: dynamin family protein [Acidobacteriaceae bacterium]|nr:dynamin family protein [Acidobacteriaceae bacterium]